MVQYLDLAAADPDLLYPESDGKPLADNTIQFHLIMKIQGGIDALFANDPDVFVAGDLLWYPIEGSSTSQAPDVMVVFGRPKGHRRSYIQFREENIAPQVVFEILSHSNTRKEMANKLQFYRRHGVEEYYLYDPDKNTLQGWLRQDRKLLKIPKMEGWVSPRLGSRFETRSGTLEVYKPDGQRFQTYVEASQRAEQEAQRAKQEAQRAEQEAQRAEQEAQRAEQEAQRAEQEAQSRHEAIPRLLALGLSAEQVAEALGFSVAEVSQYR